MANRAAQQLGRRGGKARAASMSAKERSESARKAVQAPIDLEKE
jgi:hypothetical protein